MIAYCPKCEDYTKLHVNQTQSFNHRLDGIVLEVLCLNCGSSLLFGYELCEVKIQTEGEKDLSKCKASSKSVNTVSPAAVDAPASPKKSSPSLF